MSEGKWEVLPDNTLESCDKADFGWSPHGTDRCGLKASFIRRGTCSCGKCDMTVRHCADHQAEYLKEHPEEYDLDQALEKTLGRPLTGAESGVVKMFIGNVVNRVTGDKNAGIHMAVQGVLDLVKHYAPEITAKHASKRPKRARKRARMRQDARKNVAE